MKLIGLKKNGNQARVEFFGCPLRCDYCTRIRQDKKDHEVTEVVEFLADPAVEDVYIGGAEPTLQKRELLDLLQRLRRMNKRITLKTRGNDPEFLKSTIGTVDRYVVEVKCPLDDAACYSELIGLSRDRTRQYINSLDRSLDVLKGQKVRVWIRAIPGFVTPERIESIGKQISGRASEVFLYQFLSNPADDAPFREITEPGPSETEMVAFARKLVRHVPRVIVRGRGFESEFSGNVR
ncbi:MAG: radical SAM protein [Methanomassiliicoccales archaeon]|jgi:pyruvate formate lyase activating enzyme